MKNKVFNLVLALNIIFTLLISVELVSAEALIPDPWDKPSTRILADFGVLDKNLVNKGREKITREDFCNIIISFYEDISESNVTGRNKFKDTKNANIEKAAYLGIVTGISEHNFAPESIVTREQAAVILDRLIISLGLDTQINSNKTVNTFSDDIKFSSWAKDSIYKIANMSIMKGVGNNNFDSKSKYSIEQTAITIHRIYNEVYISKINDKFVSEKIKSLKTEYYHGRNWTNDDYEDWNGGIWPGGRGCYGFALRASDIAFGALPARVHTDLDNIKIGDIIRVQTKKGNKHSLIVIGIIGDKYEFAEGNYGSKIHWGRVKNIDEIKRITDYVITRYPQ